MSLDRADNTDPTEKSILSSDMFVAILFDRVVGMIPLSIVQTEAKYSFSKDALSTSETTIDPSLDLSGLTPFY